MISFIETILGTVLSSFVIVIISTFMALLVDFFFPSFSKWTRMMLIFIVITVVLQPAFEHLTLIRDIAHSIFNDVHFHLSDFDCEYDCSGWGIQFVELSTCHVVVCKWRNCFDGKVLIPLLTAALIFDLVSRITSCCSVY